MQVTIVTCVYSEDGVLHNWIIPSEIELPAFLSKREGSLLVLSPHVFDLCPFKLLWVRKTVLVGAVRQPPTSMQVRWQILLEFITCSEEILLTVSGAKGQRCMKQHFVSFLFDRRWVCLRGRRGKRMFGCMQPQGKCGEHNKLALTFTHTHRHSCTGIL